MPSTTTKGSRKREQQESGEKQNSKSEAMSHLLTMNSREKGRTEAKSFTSRIEEGDLVGRQFMTIMGN